MGTADTTSLKLSQNALLKALVGDLVCMYDVNVHPVYRRMVGHCLVVLTYCPSFACPLCPGLKST